MFEMKSIKEFSVRATKRGKTRGRPSKEEMLMSAFLSYYHKKHYKEIRRKVFDIIVYGRCE